LVNEGLDGDPKIKLKQVESDRGVYERIIGSDDVSPAAFTESEKATNVYRNYTFFRNQIEQSEVGVQELYKAVFKLEIIDVCLTTEDPQEVFESMNSTGKALTNTDLLRNYLLMSLTGPEQEKLYKNYWSKIERNVGAKQMESFMVQYLIMKRKSDSMNIRKKSAKINRTTLYDCYKIIFPPEEKNLESTEELLADMQRFSAYYSRIYSGSRKTPLDRAINEVIFDLSADPVAILLMYLFSEQEALGITDAEMTDIVKACVSYVFRVRIFKGSVAPQFFALTIQYFEKGDEEKSFVERIWDALVTGSGSYRFPRDREFRDAFENKNMYMEFKPPMLRYMLYKYERARTKDVVDPEDVTIEHILPQDTKEWQKHLSDIKDYEYRELIHRIGNLTLTKMNGEASNDPFSKKKKIYEKSGYLITRELAKKEDWNSAEIKKRSSEMAKEALELWPLPERFNQGTEMLWETTNMNEETEELFNTFRETVHSFDASIYEEPTKYYVNFLRNNKPLFSIIPGQESLKVTLNARIDQLTPNDNLEDVSSKGHWGIGQARMEVTNEEDIWTVLDYVQQMAGF
ncbi:MAG: DUF1524 domain-containing protein, partial [Eggerthellaceae bacterium]|nr:DUF1524 domain-containing protein [Eggerthellaceae bacterium]